MMESPSLEVFKKCVGVALQDMVYWYCVGWCWVEWLGLMILQVFSNRNASMILWVYPYAGTQPSSLRLMPWVPPPRRRPAENRSIAVCCCSRKAALSSQPPSPQPSPALHPRASCSEWLGLGCTEPRQVPVQHCGPAELREITAGCERGRTAEKAANVNGGAAIASWGTGSQTSLELLAGLAARQKEIIANPSNAN